MAKERAKRQRRNRPVTVYGRFLQWVRFKYDLNQSDLANIMGTSQSTVSNWEIGEYEASWRANSRMADELDFDPELRRLSGLVFAYGQGTPAPAEEPADFPYSLARSLIIDETESKPRFPGGAQKQEHFDAILDHEAELRESQDKDEGNEGGNGPGGGGT